MYAWEIISGDGVDALHLGERETPIPGPWTGAGAHECELY